MSSVRNNCLLQNVTSMLQHRSAGAYFYKKLADFLLLTPYFLLLTHSILLASEPPKLFNTANKLSKQPMVRTRFTIAPLISIYKLNKNHAGSPTQKMAALFSLKEEIRLNDKHNAFFLIGVEYMPHGLNFSSYYFKPDSVQLYTETFNASYSLYVHELNFPIQMKLSLKRENNAVWTPYIMIGYHLRQMLGAKVKVSQNGELVETRKVDVTFKNSIITPKQNGFASFTLGFQKNNPNNTRHCIFGEISYRMGFSPFMIKDSFAPSSLYIRGSFLAFGLGAKF